MQNKIITISRQYGSGGREIGKILARRLGIGFYDKEIISLASKQSGIRGDFFQMPEQKDFLFRDFSASCTWEPTLSDKAYLSQCSVIQSLAQQGPCVMVGRGAGCVLKDTAPLLNVFIYADFQTRKKRSIEQYGDNPYKIEEHINSIDKKRAAYFKFYAGVDGRQMERYHLCINSGFTGLENATTLIESAYLSDWKNV